MRRGVKEKSPLVAISSPFDVRLNAKYISALLAAVSRGQERSLKNFGSNSLRACPGEINRQWQSAASGAGGGAGEKDRPLPPHPCPPEPLSHRPGGAGTTAAPRSLRAHHLPPGPALQPLASAQLGVGGFGGFFRWEGFVSRFPPSLPVLGSRRRAMARFPLFTSIQIHIFSPRAEVSSSKAESKNNLQDLVWCYWYLSLSALQTRKSKIFPEKEQDLMTGYLPGATGKGGGVKERKKPGGLCVTFIPPLLSLSFLLSFFPSFFPLSPDETYGINFES